MPRVDLSHTIEDGMIIYKGLPAPVLCDFLSREVSREIYSAGPPKLRAQGTFPVQASAHV